MSDQPTCDTDGCSNPIPKGGEGHPEICHTCLDWMKKVDAAWADSAKDIRKHLLEGAHKALKHRKKAETDGAARIAYDFLAHEYLDQLLMMIAPPGSLMPLKEV
jgi:hypothetical protein